MCLERVGKRPGWRENGRGQTTEGLGGLRWVQNPGTEEYLMGEKCAVIEVGGRAPQRHREGVREKLVWKAKSQVYSRKLGL